MQSTTSSVFVNWFSRIVSRHSYQCHRACHGSVKRNASRNSDQHHYAVFLLTYTYSKNINLISGTSYQLARMGCSNICWHVGRYSGFLFANNATKFAWTNSKRRSIFAILPFPHLRISHPSVIRTGNYWKSANYIFLWKKKSVRNSMRKPKSINSRLDFLLIAHDNTEFSKNKAKREYISHRFVPNE